MSENTASTQQSDHTVAKITVISVTLVIFACLVVFTILALIIIDEIPFHHLFDKSDYGSGAGILVFQRFSDTFYGSKDSLNSEPEQNEISHIGDHFG